MIKFALLIPLNLFYVKDFLRPCSICNELAVNVFQILQLFVFFGDKTILEGNQVDFIIC